LQVPRLLAVVRSSAARDPDAFRMWTATRAAPRPRLDEAVVVAPLLFDLHAGLVPRTASYLVHLSHQPPGADAAEALHAAESDVAVVERCEHRRSSP
jgi:hypothetical protein